MDFPEQCFPVVYVFAITQHDVVYFFDRLSFEWCIPRVSLEFIVHRRCLPNILMGYSYYSITSLIKRGSLFYYISCQIQSVFEVFLSRLNPLQAVHIYINVCKWNQDESFAGSTNGKTNICKCFSLNFIAWTRKKKQL